MQKDIFHLSYHPHLLDATSNRQALNDHPACLRFSTDPILFSLLEFYPLPSYPAHSSPTHIIPSYTRAQIRTKSLLCQNKLSVKVNSFSAPVPFYLRFNLQFCTYYQKSLQHNFYSNVNLKKNIGTPFISSPSLSLCFNCSCELY